MSRNAIAALTLLVAAIPAWSAPQDSIRDTIAQGEELYFEAQFAKAIEVLLPVDNLLANIPGPTPEKISVKLHLALSYLGLNDTNLAKGYLRALYAMSPQHVLDPLQFPPKVLQLAEEARNEQLEIECRRLLSTARAELDAGNAAAVLKLLESTTARCPAVSALARETSELFYKNGMDAYRRSEMKEALEAFKAALRLDSEHEFAAQYIELTQSRLELDADRLFLAWRRNFDVGAFRLAANDYHQLLAVADREQVDQIHAEYRRAVLTLLDARMRACERNDTAAVERLSAEATEMLPDPSIADDLLGTMRPCRNTACLEMAWAQAQVRLKTKIDPEIPQHAKQAPGSEPITVNVQARVSESGDVMLAESTGGNIAINEAVNQAVRLWKFSPAIVRDEPRCVDTEIPIVIRFEETQ